MKEFKLINKKINNNHNNEEKKIFDRWHQKTKEQSVYFQQLKDAAGYWKYAAAATALFVLVSIPYHLFHKEENSILNDIFTIKSSTITSGADMAFLTLDDNSKISFNKSRPDTFKNSYSSREKLFYNIGAKDSINTLIYSKLRDSPVATTLIKAKVINDLTFKSLSPVLQAKVSIQARKLLIITDEWPQMRVLAQSLQETGKFKIDLKDQKIVDSGLKDYEAVFMYIHAVLKKETENLLIKYTKSGGRLIVLHHGIASAKLSNPKWLKFLGIQLYPRDAPEYSWGVLADTTHTMVNLAPEHYITTNKISYTRKIEYNTDYSNSFSGSYDVFDLTKTEIFMNQRFVDIQQKKILYGFATANQTIMQPTSGWYEEKGDGWLFYFQPGHTVSDFQNDNFRQVLINALEWNY